MSKFGYLDTRPMFVLISNVVGLLEAGRAYDGHVKAMNSDAVDSRAAAFLA